MKEKINIWLKENWLKVIIILFLILSIWGYFQYYIPYKHLKEGWVSSATWDCPSDHPIKANLNSGIYHTPSSPYYQRTNASNSECFDTAEHAKEQGFRPPLK